MEINEYAFGLLDISDKAWFEFLALQADATVFHHPLWSICLSESYRYRPFVIVMKDSEGKIVGGLPVMEIDSWLTGKRWVSLPFTDHCSPLLRNKDDLEKFCLGVFAKSNELKGDGLELRFKILGADTGANNTNYYIHYLKCSTTFP